MFPVVNVDVKNILYHTDCEIDTRVVHLCFLFEEVSRTFWM